MDFRVKPGNDREESPDLSAVMRGLDPHIHPSGNNLIVQVTPFRILRRDQIDLPLARPMLDILLTLYRGCRRIVSLVIHEHLDLVPFREARNRAGSMLVSAAREITGDPNV